MFEVRIPLVGYAKFEWGDIGFLLFGSGILLWSTNAVVTSNLRFPILLALVVIELAAILGIWWTTISLGRRRVLWEEWPNPVAMRDALRNHAFAEGI